MPRPTASSGYDLVDAVYDQVVDCSRIARFCGLDEVETGLYDLPVRNMRYRRLSDEERAEIDAKVRRELARHDLSVAAAGDPERWERGWGEVLHRVRREGASLETLRPQYFHYDIVRLDGDYARVADSRFEYDLYTAFRRVLLGHYLADCDRVIEFGCGTGSTLLMLAGMFPGRPLVGADWARPSQELLRLIAAEQHAPVTGVRFNMLTLEGSHQLPVGEGTAVVTLHALEQLGDHFAPMLNFLVASRPTICLHIEPIIELYDPTSPFDAAAIAYHTKRNYLRGFLPALQRLALAGQVEVLAVRRLGLGSTFHEGYSLIVWRPLRNQSR